MKPIPSNKFTDIDQAAHSGAFGNNPLPLPTDKQIAAGTYKKGKVSLYGLTIAIEQPQNSYRTGTDKDGKRWSCRLAANYGYILGTKAKDGDNVDCFIGSYPQSDRVFIINQYINGVFDEHKVMLAYPAIEFAISDYRYSFSRDWDGLHSIVETSVKNLKWWLKNGDMSKPITAEQLPPESENDMKVFWDSANQPIGTNYGQLLYDLRKIDADDGLLLDAVSIGDFIHDADAGSVDFGVLLDSLHTPYSSLARVCSKIGFAMKNQAAKDSQGNDLTLVESTPDEPNPSGLDTTFKRNGVVNLAAVYQLTDGQSFTIVFHNPDSTPGKLAKTDTLIAWKFLLNKRDITIAVAPEKGEDLKLPEVAKRVMMLAEKNSAAFARANKGAADRAQLISGLKTEIAELEQEKAQAQADYEAAKAAYDEREIAKATEPKAAFVPTHTVDDDGVQVPVKMNDDGVWESENGTEYDGYDAEPIANNPVQPIGKSENGNSSEILNSSGIDPATLANINASSLSAALKKKAIAFFEKNPSAKSFDGSGLGKPSQKAIMESIKTAFLSEVISLSDKFIVGGARNDQLELSDENTAILFGFTPDDKKVTGWRVDFKTIDKENRKTNKIFDSTTTLEDLRSWGFALPFDLDVKAFVANVIKPVVDEFLGKESRISTRTTVNLPVGWGVDEFEQGKFAVVKMGVTQKDIVYTSFEDAYAAAEGFVKQQTTEPPAQPENTPTKADAIAGLELLKNFVGRSQLSAIRTALNGEEGDFFIKKITDLVTMIKGMPKTYDTDGQGNNAVAYLHYFKNSADWYITEKDKGAKDDAITGQQIQAFGLADLFGDGGELGYISIKEVIDAGAELDFYWTPKPLKAIGETSQPEPQPPAQPETTATSSFDTEIENLRGLIGTPTFYDVLEPLIERMESDGVMNQYSSVIDDLIVQDAQAEAAKVG